jgi:hypothetical protein
MSAAPIQIQNNQHYRPATALGCARSVRYSQIPITSTPAGMLLNDGTAYKRTRFPDLFAKIGTTWGLGTGGDVTTFGVPNLMDTGRFKRSSSGSLFGRDLSVSLQLQASCWVPRTAAVGQ